MISRSAPMPRIWRIEAGNDAIVLPVDRRTVDFSSSWTEPFSNGDPVSAATSARTRSEAISPHTHDHHRRTRLAERRVQRHDRQQPGFAGAAPREYDPVPGVAGGHLDLMRPQRRPADHPGEERDVIPGLPDDAIVGHGVSRKVR